jgi:hypothetical protein
MLLSIAVAKKKKIKQNKNNAQHAEEDASGINKCIYGSFAISLSLVCYIPQSTSQSIIIISLLRNDATHPFIQIFLFFSHHRLHEVISVFRSLFFFLLPFFLTFSYT